MKKGCWTLPNSTGRKKADKTTQLQTCANCFEKRENDSEWQNQDSDG